VPPQIPVQHWAFPVQGSVAGEQHRPFGQYAEPSQSAATPRQSAPSGIAQVPDEKEPAPSQTSPAQQGLQSSQVSPSAWQQTGAPAGSFSVAWQAPSQHSAAPEQGFPCSKQQMTLEVPSGL
jgi:hypothetical protein